MSTRVDAVLPSRWPLLARIIGVPRKPHRSLLEVGLARLRAQNLNGLGIIDVTEDAAHVILADRRGVGVRREWLS